LAPRVDVEALCNEVVGPRERPGLVVDLSATGLRLERPYVGGARPEVIQLELELPEADEILWARGDVCFDAVKPGPLGLLRTTGIRFAAAAARDLKVLRDYVIERRRARARSEASVEMSLAYASSYARG
jgi:hypothetical protein